MNIPFVITIGVPMLLALTIDIWFWKIRAFKALREQAEIFDSEVIPSAPSAMPLKKLRKWDDLGDKMVVSHHLMGAVDDVTDSIRETTLLATALVLLLYLFVVYVQAAAPTSQSPSPSPTLLSWVKSIPSIWALPLGEFAALLLNVGAVIFLRKQIRRYRDVLGRV